LFLLVPLAFPDVPDSPGRRSNRLDATDRHNLILQRPRMNHPTDEFSEPGSASDWSDLTEPINPSVADGVEELSPDGGRIDSRTSPTQPPVAPQPLPDPDEDPPPELVWYVLKVQSSREDTIRDALERRVKIQGLQRYFGRIVVPTEKIVEIRNNKKRTVERKTYPGYIMVEMELNEKTWFTVRETPGVGDFVGAHGTPTKMTPAEVEHMIDGERKADSTDTKIVHIEVERGDRVKIKDGPFENFEGTVEEVIQARGLVKVMLIIFNRPTPVDLEYWQVERL
jgi:transcriptional antiterminator NusG